MARKIKDIAVKTSTYVDNTGKEKGRYENVGVLMQGDDGNQFIILNRTFNPAGVPVAPGKDTVILSLFDPQNAQQPPAQNMGYQQQPAAQAQNFQQPQGQQNQMQNPPAGNNPQQPYGQGVPVGQGY